MAPNTTVTSGAQRVELILALALGGLVVVAVVLSPLFADGLALVGARSKDPQLVAAVTRITAAVRESAWVQRPEGSRLEIVTPQGVRTTYMLEDETLRARWDSGVTHDLLDGVANLQFEVETQRRLRDAPPTQLYGTWWQVPEPGDGSAAEAITLRDGEALAMGFVMDSRAPASTRSVPDIEEQMLATTIERLLLPASYLGETPALLRPFLSCVEESEDGQAVAHFGYFNPNPWIVTVPVGEDNRMQPSGEGAQGNVFQPGRHDKAVSVSLRSGKASWTLNGVTATADKRSPPLRRRADDRARSGGGSTVNLPSPRMPPPDEARHDRTLMGMFVLVAVLGGIMLLRVVLSDPSGPARARTSSLFATPPEPGTFTISLYEARAPGDARPWGEALASLRFPTMALPWATFVEDQSGRHFVRTPAKPVPLDVASLASAIEPGRAYTLVLEVQGPDRIFVRSLATDAPSGVALRGRKGDFEPRSVAVPYALEGTATFTQTEQHDVVSAVTVGLERMDGTTFNDSAAVTAQIEVPNPWLGQVPGEDAPVERSP